jgi:hypothetical protein
MIFQIKALTLARKQNNKRYQTGKKAGWWSVALSGTVEC